MKKRFCILLAMIMVFCLLPMSTTAASAVWDGTIATAYAGGTGTQAAPYQIANGEQLAYLAQQVNAGTTYANTYFVLTDDIVLNDTTDWQTWSGTVSPTNQWTPIGLSWGLKFAGIFDGGNHTVSGIYINSTEKDKGLFSYTNSTSTIKNLGVIDSYIKGEGNVGAIVAQAGGSIINCYNTGTVVGGYAGGIMCSGSAIVQNCINMGTVIGTGEAGGVVSSNSSEVSNCVNLGTVGSSDQSPYSAGGLVGTNFGEVVRCYNGANVIGGPNSNQVGGIVGGNDGGTIQNCYNTGTITRGHGISGVNYSRSTDDISRCYNAGTIDSGRAGITGSYSGYETYCYYLDTTATVGFSVTADVAGVCESLTDAQMQGQANFAGFDFTDVWTMAGDATYLYPELQNMPTLPDTNPDPDPASTVWDGTAATGFDSGSGTDLDPYIIMTPEQLAYFRDQVNGGRTFEGEYVRVGADLHMNDTTSWQTWSDTVTPTNTWTPIGTVYNSLFAGTFDGGNHTISGIYINTTEDYAGLFGLSEAGSIISGVGVIDSYIFGSSYVGGIVGTNQGTVTKCYNYATVSGNCYVGGISGLSTTAPTMDCCYNAGTIIGRGEDPWPNGGVGGLLGNGGYFSNCFNAGTVTVSGSVCAGGLVGIDYGSITDSYNVGSVTGPTNKTGLIAGRSASNYAVYNSGTYYLDDATSLVAAGEYYTGGLDYPTTTTNNVDIPGTAPLTDAQMRTQASFTGWDFTNVWTMAGDVDYLYPELRDMPAPDMPIPAPEPQPIALTVATLGGAARFDKTAIRFGASISFADMAALNVGDTVDYGFSINGLSGDALTSANWTKLSAASTTVNFAGFEWTAAMEVATTTEALAAVIRATGIKVYEYDATTITFAIILNNLPMAAQDSLWVFEPYVTINATDTSLGTAKYNSINRILEGTASGTYVA